MPTMTAYATTKAAVKAFADVLRLETLGTGIHVHIAQTGTMYTPLFADLKQKADQVPTAC
jgi:short-subunit dehydrogenase